MDRYKRENAIDQVRGFYAPAPGEVTAERGEAAFERARAECIAQLEAQIAGIKALSFGQFTARWLTKQVRRAPAQWHRPRNSARG